MYPNKQSEIILYFLTFAKYINLTVSPIMHTRLKELEKHVIQKIMSFILLFLSSLWFVDTTIYYTDLHIEVRIQLHASIVFKYILLIVIKLKWQ